MTVHAGDEAMATLKITGESNYEEVKIYRKDIPDVNAVAGALPGKFSVSESKKVQFSQGNLQYCAFSDVWRFALHQYDIVGELNRYRTENYRCWIDLFMHGASGYQKMKPWLRTTEISEMTQCIFDTEYDWGKHNKISNGGNTKGIWYTPTMDEWEYILYVREGAEVLRGAATVNQRRGFVLLPANWVIPSGVRFKANPADYTTNSYDLQQWEKMEKAGAVFFPMTGYYDGYNYQEEGAGYSVSTIPFNTPYDYIYVWYFYHDGTSIACFIGGAIINSGTEPVRLVKYAD